MRGLMLFLMGGTIASLMCFFSDEQAAKANASADAARFFRIAQCRADFVNRYNWIAGAVKEGKEQEPLTQGFAQLDAAARVEQDCIKNAVVPP